VEAGLNEERAPLTCERCDGPIPRRKPSATLKRFCSRACKDAPFEVRLFDQITQGAEGDCWPWTGHVNTSGYGQIWHGKRLVLAHRVMFARANGEISEGMLVLHHCDNPSCCNPAHLFVGTDADNARDKQRKGRCHDTAGEKNPRARLTAQDIRDIRAMGTTPRSVIAERYSIGVRYVSRIRHRQLWGSVA
jgi:hypothetical protein